VRYAQPDLADLAALTRANLGKITEEDIEAMHPAVRGHYRRIFEKIQKRENKEK